jgi:Ca2+-binding EF-hand superfamily protein
MLSNKPIVETVGIRLVTKISGNVEEIFREIDKDGNGYIDHDELLAVLGKMGCANIDKTTANSIFKQVDTDGDGKIDIEEFTHW